MSITLIDHSLILAFSKLKSAIEDTHDIHSTQSEEHYEKHSTKRISPMLYDMETVNDQMYGSM
jgi:hypothetical protein